MHRLVPLAVVPFVAALVGCGAPRSSAPLAAAIAGANGPLAAQADGFVPPTVRDPSGALVGWLDLRYAESDGVPAALQSLDLIAPAGVVGADDAPVRDLPIVVFIHGGGWSRGDKRAWLERRAAAFGRAGCILASVNYRLSPQYRHPAHVEDVAASVAWLHQHARAFGGDPRRIVLLGHSSGAHLAALVATDERWLAAHELPLATIGGVILLDGASYDVIARGHDFDGAEGRLETVFGEDRAAWADASPVNHVAAGKGIPPFLLLTANGRAESTRSGGELRERLEAAGVRCELEDVAGTRHGAMARDLGIVDDAATRRVLRFLADVAGAEPLAPEPPAAR